MTSKEILDLIEKWKSIKQLCLNIEQPITIQFFDEKTVYPGTVSKTIEALELLYKKEGEMSMNQYKHYFNDLLNQQNEKIYYLLKELHSLQILKK